MKTTAVKSPALRGGLFVAIVSLGVTCFAQSQGQQQQPMGVTRASASDSASVAAPSGESITGLSAGSSQEKPDDFTESRVGLSLLKNITRDQEAIWTSPLRWRRQDASWLLPFAGIAAVSLVSDTRISKALTKSTSRVSESNTFSNYGIAAFGGVTGGLYLLGKITHDDHKREAGVLSGEAALDAVGASTILQFAFERQRPTDGAGGGGFWQHGTSFPSDHAAAAWAVASVIAHEYPGPLTKVLVYGLASAVSASRVTGKDHFPTDVIAGAAIGWFVGQQVYRAHHDRELGGSSGETFSEAKNAEPDRSSVSQGSPYVPMDSWVYPAFEQLIAMGYVQSGLTGIKPWTRLECARLTVEAEERITEALGESAEPTEYAARLQAALAREFSRELSESGGSGKETLELESVYTRVTSVSGPLLTDGYHYGQTISYDFGRPLRRGVNVATGGAVWGAAGPFTFYLRAEYQHSPAAPALSESILNLNAALDSRLPQPATVFPEINRADLLEGYVGVNVKNWELLFGKQSTDWSIEGTDSLLLSNNAEPIPMLRIDRILPYSLDGIFPFLGPVKTEFFIGQLAGHDFIRKPYIYGQKVSFKLFWLIELGYGRTTMLGGTATPESQQLGVSIDAFTSKNFLYSFFAIPTVAQERPGNSQETMDFSLRIPRISNGVLLYGEFYQDDEPIIFRRPERGTYRPGLYIEHLPHLPKLSFRIEETYTKSSKRMNVPGQLNYWHDRYRDGQTDDGNLLGNAVGRAGVAVQGWWNLRFSETKSLEFSAKFSSVDQAFIPGGGQWQDFSVRHTMQFRSGWYMKNFLQFEHISSYPVLFNGPVNNVVASVEVGFSPRRGAP